MHVRFCYLIECFEVEFIDCFANWLSLFSYDHLAKVLTKILDERPENVVDTFEDISQEEKRARFRSDVDTVQDKVDKTTEVGLAEIQEKLFKV